MFVLSVEGSGFLDRGLWSTHKILGIFESEEKAMESSLLNDLDAEEDVCIITDMSTGTVKRVDLDESMDDESMDDESMDDESMDDEG